MQKPENKSIKDFILEKTATELQFDPEIVENVISWSYKQANKATHTNNEVEISGFGKLQLSQAKLRKYIDKLEGQSRNTEGQKHEDINRVLEDVKTKRHVKED